MSREISSDFKNLLEYIKSYSIKHTLDLDQFKQTISAFHKKYYAYLTLIGEIQFKLNHDPTGKISQTQFTYLLESCSDIGTSFFNLLHGSYKSSKLILRSSIETFLKGFTMDEYKDVITETSMFNVFRNVKALSFFRLGLPNELINDTHNIYKALCADVHTAQEINMEKITALNNFPKYSKNEADVISGFSLDLICCYITLICLKYNE